MKQLPEPAPVKAYLTRRRPPRDDYILTQHPPALEHIGDTEDYDVYIVPGDGIAFQPVCAWAAERIWGVVDAPPFIPIPVWFFGGLREE